VTGYTKLITDYLSLWQLFVLTVTFSFLATEGGFRLGRRRRESAKAEKDALVNAVVGATLGLLAFMIAMTFGVAMGQFDMRRKAFIDEVDSISTAYLRADFLPLEQRDNIRTLLREYVGVRLKAADTGNLSELRARSEAIHQQLWSQVLAAQDGVHSDVLFGLFVQSLGEVMDVHTRRIFAAFQSRIPPVIWFVLYSVAILGMAEIGYQAALSGSSRSPMFIALVLSFASVLWIVADLDRPREGAIKISQRPMRDLERSMAANP
jgi:hypothetical protein